MINIEQSVKNYKTIIEGVSGNTNRLEQVESLSMVLKKYFEFENIECIETGASQNFLDGCFGLFLCDLVNQTNGIYHSVDIEYNIVENSKKIYNQYYPNTNVNHHVMDSIQFLQNYKGIPNLVHLDSWDLDLENPIPSMLHGWLEFDAIKDKIPSGGICIIDDNFLKGTWVSWNIMSDNVLIDNKIIDIDYDIIGKGALIYHWCKNYATDWEIIGNHYNIGPNIKIIIRKK